MLLEERPKFLCWSRNPLLRDDIAGEGLAHHLAIDDLGCRRVVDSTPVDIATKSILPDHFIREQADEIGSPEFVDRNRDPGGASAGIRFVITLIRSVEEGLVLAVVKAGQIDRPAYRAPPIVPAVPLLWFAVVVVHERVRIHPLVVNESYS